jgi:hypothetical protein
MTTWAEVYENMPENDGHKSLVMAMEWLVDQGIIGEYTVAGHDYIGITEAGMNLLNGLAQNILTPLLLDGRPAAEIIGKNQ